MLALLRLRIAKSILPAGYVVAPLEPTKPMIKAACAALYTGNRPTKDWVSVAQKHKIRYTAMIKAVRI